MPNDYDKIIKENFEPLLPHLLRKILGLELPKLEDLKDKIQITTEREMDNLKKVVHDNPLEDFGLHWEIQSADEDMRARNLLYYGIFYQKYGIPLHQVVIYVGNEKAKNILNNTLSIKGLELNFTVVDLKSIPKDVFLQSNTPEEVILAILCDFGQDQPVAVIRQILQHLMQLVGRVPRLKKYQNQLAVLSRLRKLQKPTINEIKSMPIHYDIATDELYLEGIEKGIEKGIEQGLLIQKKETIIKMLQTGKYSLDEIILVTSAAKEFVLQIAQDLNISIK